MFKSLIILGHLIGVLFLSVLFSDEISITDNFPEKLKVGESVVVKAIIAKNDVSGFAKYQIDAPRGIVIKPINLNGASFTFKDGKAKFIWMNLPSNPSFDIEYELTLDEGKVRDEKIINSRFSYLVDNERKIHQGPNHVLTVVGEDGAVASHQSTTSSEISAIRKIVPEGDNKYLVEIDINKLGVKGFAKIQDMVPAGFVATEVVNSQAIFTQTGNKVKLVWFDIPKKMNLTVSYLLEAPEDFSGDAVINGKFHYMSGSDLKKVEIPSQTITIGGGAVASNVQNGNTSDTPEANTTRSNTENNTASNNTNSTMQDLSTSQTDVTNTITDAKNDLTDNVDQAIENIETPATSTVNTTDAPTDIDHNSVVNNTNTTASNTNTTANNIETEGVNNNATYNNVLGEGSNETNNTATIENSNTTTTENNNPATTETNSNSVADPIASTTNPVANTIETTQDIADNTSQTVENTTESNRNTTSESSNSGSNVVTNNTTTTPANHSSNDIATNNTNSTTELSSTKTPDMTTAVAEPESTAVAVREYASDEVLKEESSLANISNVPGAEKGISYRVQIMAGKKVVGKEYLRKRHHFYSQFTIEHHEGWIKYTSGSYMTYKVARNQRNMIRDQYNFNGPFVSAYNDGVRITVQEALMISKQQWYQ